MSRITNLLDVRRWVAADSYEFEHAKPEAAASGTLKALTAAALLAAFLVIGLNQVIVHDNIEEYDIPTYLMEAVRIAEFGGVSAWPGMVVSGEYPQALQNPLYILAITPFAELDTDFMISAKLVSLFFGALAMLVGYYFIQRFYSHLVAAIASAGFVMTHLYVEWSTLVACESLLVLLSIGGILAVMKGFTARRFWVLAGFLFGLGYLTKITALFLLPGFAVAVLLTLRAEAFRCKECYLFVAAFLIGSSPFLINNAIVYGNPVYHVTIDFMFNQGGAIEYHETSMQVGSMIPRYAAEEEGGGSATILPSSGRVSELISVALKRLPREMALFAETLSPWALRWAPLPARWAFGFLVLGLFIVGLRREKNIGAQIYVAATVIFFVLVLTLHRPLPRYLLPVTFFVWVYAAMGLLYLTGKYATKLNKRQLNQGLAAAVLAACLGTIAVFGLTKPIGKNPIARVGNSAELPPHRAELLDWMRRNIGAEDRYVEGPNVRWLLEDGVYLFPSGPVRESRDEFRAFVDRHGVKYVIAEMDSMHKFRYRGGLIDRQLKFQGVLDFDQQAGIRELDVPDNWHKVLEDQNGIVEYIVYEVKPRSES
ncbi:MAG: glycosyltransferase family 39 protein [Pseudomonadota bacterium]